jgi:hypothetical protein
MKPTRHLELDDDLKALVEEFARGTGKTPNEIIRQALDEYAARRNGGSGTEAPPESAYDAFNRAGLIGAIDGPGDKSTNPKYFGNG